MHDRFSTNPASYPGWVFDGYGFGEEADVLEVGCGEGVIWRKNAERIPEGWRLTLTDLSEGMVEAARAVLGDRAQYGVASIEELPFADESFDGAIANHMLFHLEDRTRAFSEIRRVLRPGGLFVATAIGRDHLRELWGLEPPRDGIWSKTRERFTIELARGELAPFFSAIELERYPDSLEVTDAEALVDVFRSRGDVPEERFAAIRVHVAEAIDRDGSFHVTKDTARIRCRKP
jgi:ubiquinone/menaquinone biosynthesis C-methylase UbiE